MTVSVIAPANRRAVGTQPTSMPPASAYGREDFIRRRRSLTEFVIAPAYYSAISAKSADMTMTSVTVRLAAAYRREGFIRRRQSLAISVIAPAYRSAIRTNTAGSSVSGAYGAECHCARCACGCRRVVDGLLRACVVRICEQGEQQERRRCEDGEEVERVFRTYIRGGGVNRMFGILLLHSLRLKA